MKTTVHGFELRRFARELIAISAGLLTLFSPVNSVLGQTHLWSQRFGGTDGDYGRSVANDVSSNVILTGSFGGTVDFGGGALTSAGSSDMYLVKYDASGNHIWSQRFGGTSSDYGTGVATDGSNSVFVTGDFEGTVNFGGENLTSAGHRDVFLAKYDASGSHLWSKRFGDADYESSIGVTIDGSGNVVVIGWFWNSIDFGGGVLTSVGVEDIFLAKFDNDGDYLWSQRFGGAGQDGGQSVVADGAGNVVITGYFNGTADFGGGGLTAPSSSPEIFLAKYDAGGVHQWSKRLGGTGSDVSYCVCVDESNSIFLTGGFSNTADFGGGGLTSAGSQDIFLAKYDALGSYLWSKRFGDTDWEGGHSVSIDATGNVAFTGLFRDTLDLGGDVLLSAGDYDIFLAQYDGSGNHLWSRCFGDTGTDRGLSLTTGGSADVVVTGVFEGTVDFGGGALTAGAGAPDIFLAKYGGNTASPPTTVAGGIEDVGNDQGRWVRITFNGSNRDGGGSPTPIIQYEAFRRIDPLPTSSPAVLGNQGEKERTSGMISNAPMLGGWEFVGAIPAHGETTYNMIAPTLADSTIQDGQHWSVFFVRAATADPYTFFDSPVDSGYSVDNLAPPPPAMLAVQRVGGDVVLSWSPSGADEPDFKRYNVYRSDTSGLIPDPMYFLSSASDASFTDAGAPTTELYYVVTAQDVNGNESDPSNEGMVGTSTGVGDRPPTVTSLTLLRNVPNPFTTTTILGVGLPREARVTMEIYDVTGRRVWTTTRKMPGGWQSITFDGRDASGRTLPSGIYFFRVSALGEHRTRKLTIMR